MEEKDGMQDKTQALRYLYSHLIANPRFVHLSTRASFVPGEGPCDAKVMVIGEAPGADEDHQRRPFVGASGRSLEQLLADVGMTRGDVFLTNVLKFQPPGGRAPSDAEVRASRVYLHQEIEIVDPALILLCGRTAAQAFVPNVRINSVHGRPFHRGRRTFLPLFHPAQGLRDSAMQRVLRQDFRMVGELADRARPCTPEVPIPV
jgi:DNA polymerase